MVQKPGASPENPWGGGGGRQTDGVWNGRFQIICDSILVSCWVRVGWNFPCACIEIRLIGTGISGTSRGIPYVPVPMKPSVQNTEPLKGGRSYRRRSLSNYRYIYKRLRFRGDGIPSATATVDYRYETTFGSIRSDPTNLRPKERGIAIRQMGSHPRRTPETCHIHSFFLHHSEYMFIELPPGS